MIYNKLTPIVLSLLWLGLTACQATPVTTGSSLTAVNTVPVESKSHTRMLETPVGTLERGAVIFSLEKSGNPVYKAAVERIVRVFAENEAPLDVAVALPTDGQDLQNIEYLVAYSDAGIIDISIDGDSVAWLNPDIPDTQAAYTQLKASLFKAREQVKALYGTSPAACLFPNDHLSNNNYSILQDAGFKILYTRNTGEFPASNLRVNWLNDVDPGGLYRLPIAGYANYTGVSSSELGNLKENTLTRGILNSVDDLVKSQGVAVIVINPEYFSDVDAGSLSVKIELLANLIKASRQYGDIVTFDGWSRARHRYVPPYNGGPAVIFRLDDVTKGFHEDVDEEIIKLFKKNGVSLDCGVISRANDMRSYDIAWLKNYVDEGVVGISVHGYDWTYYQLDTKKSNLTYEFIKDKLTQAREDYQQYFGVLPVALTVPTDFYDTTGYKAINASGFKIFATQMAIEPHMSAQPVNFYGEWDLNGMYRLPTAMDVCDWDAAEQVWGDVADVSKMIPIHEYCKNELSRTVHPTGAEVFANNICNEFGELGLAVISMHPACFVDKDGKPDQAKLQQMDTIINWAKKSASIITFEQWYIYASRH